MAKSITFNVSLAEKQAIEAAAEQAGMSMAAWCRMHLKAEAQCKNCDEGGPEWFTVTDSQLAGPYRSLSFTLQQDGQFQAQLSISIDHRHPQAQAELAWFMLELGVPCIQDTKQLHGKRIKLPQLINHEGRLVRPFTSVRELMAEEAFV